jgi:hypothetical protein
VPRVPVRPQHRRKKPMSDLFVSVFCKGGPGWRANPGSFNSCLFSHHSTAEQHF